MSEPFIGEIKMVGFNFAPRSYSLCDGQLLAISQNTSLFSLIGTIYGGDGRTTFALPDLRGRAPIHQGHGPGLSSRQIGLNTGSETNQLNVNQMPSHNHETKFEAVEVEGTSQVPVTGYNLAKTSSGLTGVNSYSNATPTVALNSMATLNAGRGDAVNNMQPVTTVNFVIAMQGLYPSRN
ncbi:phage tail protein [Shewanella sp. Scap07]|uniref:phage tail protein n=1 Tax=Shewanella sp. Scap07 TaxID=2589987 RepID=UPI0015BB0D68|nr:tail fiber protein [Shewanella sp. Scap07]QLE87646.1 phage tail protein [Shewanella sp. Scap07]